MDLEVYKVMVRIANALEESVKLQAEHVETGKRMDERQEKQEKELYDDIGRPNPFQSID